MNLKMNEYMKNKKKNHTAVQKLKIFLIRPDTINY